MDLNEFNDKYVNKLLDNITEENETTFLLGDFNIDLLKYESHNFQQMNFWILSPPV